MNDLDFLDDNWSPEEAAKDGNDGDFSPLPPGWYIGRITESKIETTKAGNGKMVSIRLDVEGPTHAGRVIFDRILVAHPKPEAQSIGRARFGQVCVSSGFDTKPSDTKSLLGKVVEMRLKIERSKDYGDSNRVVAYRKLKNGVDGGGQDVTQSFNDSDIPF